MSVHIDYGQNEKRGGNQSTKCIAMEAGTLARWEHGERGPRGVFLLRVNPFLNGDAKRAPAASRAG